MIRASKPISRLIPGQFSAFRQLHSGSRRRRYSKNDNDDDENDKGTHLYLYKSKGQHLLTNQRILDTIVRKSAIKPTDTVLEIGPGTGNLTLKLMEAANKVFAIELDSRMVEILDKRASESGLQDRLTVIRKDALKAEFPLFDLVVANIPYSISSPLVAKLVFGSIPFRSATLLLQKEFARRLLAKPGDSEFNRLAVNVTLVADVEHVMDVSRREFLPCPKVDSSVVIIRPKAQLPDVNLGEWLAFTRTCFGKKNKTLGATFKQKKKVAELLNFSEMAASNAEYNVSLNNIIKEDDDEESADSDGEEECCSCSGSEIGVSPFKEKIMRVLKSGGFDDKRPSKMSNEELLRLLALFNQAGIYFHGKSNSFSKVRPSN
ncbi:ribosomal RNA small subunit methyltransferase, mitochondrial isoform X2 [Humulus lupulus]|uniref:ribosomal RNA small subunit methyltransferase, mitochondrial isoform X2 n=1 Tax=Humulus lupulus TaxID=3486 RepID=UPI002B401D6C|nr:ribosomal RNA small subunit methyltransferase, mitochondrial isoform X2 [Humulus lupulus]